MPRTRSVRWSELKLGIAAIVAVALASGLILAVGGQGGFFWQRYPLHTRFTQVAGLKPGAVVRLNGMEVGKVTSVEFSGTEVEVGMELSRDVRHLVTTGSRASMGTLSLLGEPIVDLTASDEGDPLPDEGFVQPGRGGGVAAVADQAGRLMASVRDEDVGAIVGSAATVARRVAEGRGTLGALSADSAAYLALVATLENLADLTGRARSPDGAVGRLLSDRETAVALDSAVAGLRVLAGALARGEGTAGRIVRDPALYDTLTALARRLDAVVGALERGEGTAGRLLEDDALYDNVDRTVTELRTLVEDIRKDPRKYLSVQFSVF